MPSLQIQDQGRRVHCNHSALVRKMRWFRRPVPISEPETSSNLKPLLLSSTATTTTCSNSSITVVLVLRLYTTTPEHKTQEKSGSHETLKASPLFSRGRVAFPGCNVGCLDWAANLAGTCAAHGKNKDVGLGFE